MPKRPPSYARAALELSDRWHPESARAALEELMMTHLKDELIDGFLDQGRAEGMVQGEAQGMAKGEAQMLLRIMAARGLTIPEDIRGRVANCEDTARL